MNFVLQILKSLYFSILILFLCNLAINANEITPKRIMSLSPSITEILFEIGSENQVIAVDSLSNFPPEAPKTKISAYEPNVETISLYKPDLVILSFNIRNLKEALSKLGIETIYLPAPYNFEQILEQIDLLGKRTGNTKKAQKLLSNNKPDIFNQAIMEFGSQICKPKKPNCTICPLNDKCIALIESSIYELPVKNNKIKLKTLYFEYFFFKMNGYTLVNKRTEKGLWQNMYEFPLINCEKLMKKENILNHDQFKLWVD